MNPTTAVRLACHGLACALAGAAGCFTNDGLQGQPCQNDADCNVVASVRGQHIPCANHVCGAVCGDDIVQEPFEQCEDGNDDDNDGCVGCQDARCGDGVTHAGVEQCDDGNDDLTDACVVCANAACGDGVVWAGHETCDDRNADRTDGCVECQVVRCGDDAQNPETEACDDGLDDRDDDDGCTTTCRMGAERLARGYDAAHACVVRRGKLRCWGNNTSGQLGYGHTNIVGNERSDLPPADVDLQFLVKDVVVGPDYTCVLLDVQGDNAHCWGQVSVRFGVPELLGVEDRLGDQPGELPGPVMRLGGTVVQLSTGGYETCALLADGTVHCWHQKTDDDFMEVVEFFQLPLPGPAKQIEGGLQICAVLESGELWCHESFGPTYKVFGQRPVAQVAVGELHKCVRFADGAVHCSGFNKYWQLGYPDIDLDTSVDDPLGPGPVRLGEAAIDIAAGVTHTCAVLLGGGVKCWGTNLSGQLGYPVDEIRDPAAFEPVPLDGPARAVVVAVDRTCALLHGGEVRCWGSNADGALGVGHTDDIGDDAMEMPPGPTLLYDNP